MNSIVPGSMSSASASPAVAAMRQEAASSPVSQKQSLRDVPHDTMVKIQARSVAPHAAHATGPKPAPPSRENAPAKNSQAVRRYMELVSTAPQLFKNTGDHNLGEIELILDAERIVRVEEKMRKQFEKNRSKEAAFIASRAGVILEDAYWIVVREAVIFKDGNTGLFNRYISTSSLDGAAAGAFGLPVTPRGTLLLLREYRHQERAWRLGLPGGFRDAGEMEEAGVQREVTEELNHRVLSTQKLGSVDADFEMTPVYLCSTEELPEAHRHVEAGEAIDGPIELSIAEVKKAVVDGSYTDASGRTMMIHGPIAAALLMLETKFPHLLQQK